MGLPQQPQLGINLLRFHSRQLRVSDAVHFLQLYYFQVLWQRVCFLHGDYLDLFWIRHIRGLQVRTR